MAGDGSTPIESISGTFCVDADGAVEEELLPIAINLDGLRLERAGVHRSWTRPSAPRAARPASAAPRGRMGPRRRA